MLTPGDFKRLVCGGKGYWDKRLHQKDRDFGKVALGSTREIHHDQRPSREIPSWKGPIRGWLPAHQGSVGRREEWNT